MISELKSSSPSSKIADFMKCIESMLSCIKGSIYICGDFNIDLLNYNVNNNIYI